MVGERSVSATSTTKVVFLIFVTALLQSLFNRHISVMGYTPDVFLTVVAIAAIFGPPSAAVWIGFTFGFVVDALFRSTPFGLSAIQLAIVAYGCSSLQSALMHAVHWMIPIIVFLASAIGIIIFVICASVIGRGGYFNLHLLLLITFESLENALVALVIFSFVRWCVAPTDNDRLRVVRA